MESKISHKVAQDLNLNLNLIAYLSFYDKCDVGRSKCKYHTWYLI